VLAADSAAGLPLLDIFWTLVTCAVVALALWLLVSVLWDVFDRGDLGNGERVGWAVLVVVVPLLGCLIYLVTRSRDLGELPLLTPRGMRRGGGRSVHQ
jgi:hypothetical protein